MRGENWTTQAGQKGSDGEMSSQKNKRRPWSKNKKRRKQKKTPPFEISRSSRPPTLPEGLKSELRQIVDFPGLPALLIADSYTHLGSKRGVSSVVT